MHRIAPRAALAAMLLSTSCFPGRRQVSSLADVGKSEVVLVGKVKLTPPLEENEQELGFTTGRYRNKAILFLGDEWRDFKREPKLGDYREAVDATLGDVFFAAFPRKTAYVLLGEIILRLYGGVPKGSAYLPGGYKVDIQAEDGSVYIGTLHYHRNEFFQITKVDVEDEYDQAEAQFRQKFGPSPMLRKALLAPAK